MVLEAKPSSNARGGEMISLLLAMALEVSPPAQTADEIVLVSRRDVPATGQVVTTAGRCGDKAVAVSVSNETGDIVVEIDGSRSTITSDIFALETESRDRNVARTFLACRSGRVGGLSVTFLLAEPEGAPSRWMLRGFSIAPDLKVVSVHDDIPLEGDPADAFD